MPVQCVENASMGALFKSSRFDLVRGQFLCTYLVYLPCDFEFFGAWPGLNLG